MAAANLLRKLLKTALFVVCLALLSTAQLSPARALVSGEGRPTVDEVEGGVAVTAAETTYPLEITSPLALTFIPSPPRVGGKVSASFRIRNVTGSQMVLERLKVRIRSGDLAQDISGFANVVLGPGAEYAFKAYRILEYQGDFQAQVMAKMGGSWVRIKNNVPVYFKVYRYGWKAENSGTSAKLNAVSVLDASHVWAVGESGTILFYDGTKWVKQSSGTQNELLAVHALAADCVWAVGKNGTMRFFNGTSWISKSCGLNVVLNDVFAVSRSVVWVVGNGYETGGYLLKTTDGGGHWSIRYHDDVFCFGRIDVVNNNLLWICGGENESGEGGFIWKCTNDGSNLALSMCEYGWVGDVEAVGDTTVWAVGGTYYSGGKNFIRKSEDGGATWKNQLTWNSYVWDFDPLPCKCPTAMKALNKTSCWVVGYYGFIRFTIDGGARWQYQSSPTQNNLLGVDACDYDHAWAVGEGGAVIKYTRL